MILHRESLIKRLEDGRIFFLSDAEPKISSSSIDVTLGDWAVRFQSSPTLNFQTLLLGDPDSCKGAFGEPWKIPERGLTLAPGDCILAHTHEFVGGTDGRIVAMVKDRSTLGRYFLTTHTGAGWGDVGYHSRWTLEIKNSSPRQVRIPRRARIAQMVFFEGEETSSNYESLGGSYQRDGSRLLKMSFDEADRAWDPKLMIPKSL